MLDLYLIKMAGVQEGSWSSLSSGKKLVLAAGLSVGATMGYIVYRHIRSSSGELHGTAPAEGIIVTIVVHCCDPSADLFLVLTTLFVVVVVVFLAQRQETTTQSKFSIPLESYRSIARHQSTFLDLVSVLFHNVY